MAMKGRGYPKNTPTPYLLTLVLNLGPLYVTPRKDRVYTLLHSEI